MTKHSIMIAALCTFFITATPHNAMATSPSPFLYSGDGWLTIRSLHSSKTFSNIYRGADSQYDEKALREINAVMGARFDNPAERIELRFIEFLNYLQDHFGGGQITVASGYRSPAYNMKLRKRGGLAGKASLHQYGMAADIQIAGVKPKQLWDFLREMRFGGAGFYHGAYVHVDTGPFRFWDQRTSKVGSDVADENKLILLVVDRDVYHPRDTLEMRFARMTIWPIHVRTEFVLERFTEKGWKWAAAFTPMWKGEEEQCPAYASIQEMLGIRWAIFKKIKTGRYRIRAFFCEQSWASMPKEITSNEFLISAP